MSKSISSLKPIIHLDSHEEWDVSSNYGNQNNKHDKNVNIKILDPYRIDWNNVKISHFKDARIYDFQIKEPGWQVQRWYAKKKYLEWLRSVRKTPGWEDFRRAPIEVSQEMTDIDGNTYIVKKVIPYSLTVKPKTKIQKYLPAASKIRGSKPDDDDFRPKMFTRKMGLEISKCRNKLGLTQIEVARRMNVDVNIIRQIEMGGLIGFNPASILVKTLSRILGIPTIKYLD